MCRGHWGPAVMWCDFLLVIQIPSAWSALSKSSCSHILSSFWMIEHLWRGRHWLREWKRVDSKRDKALFFIVYILVRGREDKPFHETWKPVGNGTVLRKLNIFSIVTSFIYVLSIKWSSLSFTHIYMYVHIPLLQSASQLDCAPVNPSFTVSGMNCGNVDILQHMSCCFGYRK